MRLVFDKTIFKKIINFSGWNLTANISEILSKQGVILLINLFFQPAIVAAQAIGNQICGVIVTFVGNVRTAVNPQIIKLYASGNRAESKKMSLKTAEYIYDLLLLLGLPAILLMEPMLNLWLVEVPPYTVIFAQFIVAQGVISNFNSAFYTPMLASGKIQKNAVAAVILGTSQFGILYVILKMGGGVLWVQYIATINIFLWSCVVKPYILYKEIDYSVKELFGCYFSCFKVTMLSLLFSIPLYIILPHTLIGYIGLLLSSCIFILLSVLIFMEKEDRMTLIAYLKQRKFSIIKTVPES